MRNLKPLVPVLLLATVAGCGEKPVATEAPAPVFSYAGCFPGWTPTQVCKLFHPLSTATTYCMSGDCFEVTQGELVRVVAADERGEYPTTWFAWSDFGNLAPLPGFIPCVLTKEGKTKTRVEIPLPPSDDDARCMVSGTVGSYRYYEHFVSHPSSGCLGWLECRDQIP